MAKPSSALDPEALADARLLLAEPQAEPRMWPVVGAAALLAVSALVFAGAMILEPPLTSEHPAQARGVE